MNILFLVDKHYSFIYNISKNKSVMKEECTALLEEYKELYRKSADLIPDWQTMSKNDLCRAYVANKENKQLADSYFAAIVYRYWHLIAKYYYMSSNCASWEECYGWLVDSVYGCLSASSWERADSSIYKDPNGPDKVINRCMKCARLTYYQFINRKKRKDDFGMLSLDGIQEEFGVTIKEPESHENMNSEISNWAIADYIKKAFSNKDYFVAVMMDCITTKEVFDTKSEPDKGLVTTFNIRKLVKILTNIDDKYITEFARAYGFTFEEVEKGVSYFRYQRPPTIKAKIQTYLERLQHDSFIELLRGGN